MHLNTRQDFRVEAACTLTGATAIFRPLRPKGDSSSADAPTHDQLGSHEQELELAVRRRRQRAATAARRPLSDQVSSCPHNQMGLCESVRPSSLPLAQPCSPDPGSVPERCSRAGRSHLGRPPREGSSNTRQAPGGMETS